MSDEMAPIEFNRRLNEWIGRWASGEVKDQTALYLNKLVDQKALEAKAQNGDTKKRITIADKAKIVREWARAFVSGDDWAHSGEYKSTSESLHKWGYTTYAETGPAPGVDAPEFGPASSPEEIEAETRVSEALSQEIGRVSAENERLHEDLSRAHDWRYNLETHAREAYDVVHTWLTSPTGPSKAAVEAVLHTLREGIEWRRER